MKPEMSLALEGQTIAGKFLIESMIGQGAMGAVYRARWIALDKMVALKVMHPKLAHDEALTARFHREAKAASRLDHPNSVRVLDFGHEPDGRLYIAMELLEGRDLLAVMRDDRPLSTDRIAGILMQTLGALAVAHELGILHRDLKPENIMVLAGTDDEGSPADVVKVCDFGIAKIMSDRSDTHPSLAKGGPLTTNSTLIGTPEYMSPEQGRGDKLDPRSDLYSVGVILFQMLTGSIPFTGESAVGIILKHITDEPPRPRSLAPEVDPRLESACLKAMSKRREDRYASARDMRNELRALRENVHGMPPGPASSEPASAPLGVVSPSELDASRVPTATGIAISAVPRPRRAWIAGIALVSTLLGVGATSLLLARRGEGAPAAASASPVAHAPVVVTPPRMEPPPIALSPPSPPPPPIPSVTAVAHAAPAAPTPRPAPPPVLAHAPTDPPYDPSEASVEIASVAPDGIDGDAVRGAMDRAGLTTCYRDALTARGRRALGSATLNLSIDATGKVWGAILNGADWLPEVARCVQASAMGVHIEGATIEQGGATAAVALSFRAP